MVSPKVVARVGLSIFIVILLSSAIYFQFFETQKIQSLPDLGEVEDFTLPSINGDDFTFSSTDGNIRFVWFVYTKCQQGCSVLTTKIADVYDQLQKKGKADNVDMITIDFDFQFDSMQNLTFYADLYYQPGDSWEFLLGNENQTREVTFNWNFYFELSSPINDTDHGGTLALLHDGSHEVEYIHAFIFYVIDKNNHLRRQFIGLEWEAQDVIETVDFLNSEQQ